MTGGERLLIAGAVGLGVVAILKLRQNATNTRLSPPVGPSVIDPRFDTSGIGLAGPYGAPLAVIGNDVVKPGVELLNSAVGGVNPYAGLTRNADGTYSDGLGATVTFNPDGSVTRKNPSWRQTNGGKIISGTGNALSAIVSIF